MNRSVGKRIFEICENKFVRENWGRRVGVCYPSKRVSEYTSEELAVLGDQMIEEYGYFDNLSGEGVLGAVREILEIEEAAWWRKIITLQVLNGNIAVEDLISHKFVRDRFMNDLEGVIGDIVKRTTL